jgi:hypothetical protein
MNVHLNEEKDDFMWGLTNLGQYTIKSLYLDLINDDTKYLKKYIWKMKVPLKIKISMWFLHRKEILTKDNLIRRNWIGRESCYFVMRRNQYNTYFLTVLSQKLFGALFT